MKVEEGQRIELFKILSPVEFYADQFSEGCYRPGMQQETTAYVMGNDGKTRPLVARPTQTNPEPEVQKAGCLIVKKVK